MAASLAKALRQRSQAAAIWCLEIGRVHVLLHLGYAAGELNTRLTFNRPREVVIQPAAHVADDCLVWIHIAQATCHPAAVRISVAEPALHLGAAESGSKSAREMLGLICYEVPSLVVHDCARYGHCFVEAALRPASNQASTLPYSPCYGFAHGHCFVEAALRPASNQASTLPYSTCYGFDYFEAGGDSKPYNTIIRVPASTECKMNFGLKLPLHAGSEF